MEEEMQAIKQRLDQLQGTLLAHQVYLEAIGSELREKDWTALPGLHQRLEKKMDEMRQSPASDWTLQAFQLSIHELLSKVR